jgi:hypothetical protein
MASIVNRYIIFLNFFKNFFKIFIFIFYLILGLTPNTWRSAINKEGVVASAHMRQDSNSGKSTIHQVMSTIHTGTISYIYKKNKINFDYIRYFSGTC